MTEADLKGKSPNILSGVDDIIDRYLGITEIGATLPHYGHKKSCINLSKSPLKELDGLKLIEDVYKQIKNNWKVAGKCEGSKENWRFNICSNISAYNKSPEVKLERAIAKELAVSLSECWANQVPTASGLVPPHNDKHRNIDLVHKRGRGQYEFIELKIKSNSPLYAAMEILLYGLLYVFRRQKPKSQKAIAKSESTTEQVALLNASRIHLRVLAPPDYYNCKGNRYELGWLEDNLIDALDKMVKEWDLPFQMDFKFQCFPTLTTAELVQGIEDVRIVEELQNRQPFFSRPR